MQSQISDSASEAENKPPPAAPARETEDTAPARPQEESEETWEEKEDKLAPEKGKAGEQKYRYKEGELRLGPTDPQGASILGCSWGGWQDPAALNLTHSSCLVPKPGMGWGTEGPVREAGSWCHQACYLGVPSGFASNQAGSCSQFASPGQLCSCRDPTSLLPREGTGPHYDFPFSSLPQSNGNR